jgi:uncharacterized protein involved in outer membrane biogenesis
MKEILFIAAGFIGLLIIAAFVVPPFIDFGNYQSQYLSLAERALGRRVDVGEVRLRVLPRPMTHLSRLEISDNPQFSRAPFFTAQRAALVLKLWPSRRPCCSDRSSSWSRDGMGFSISRI